ncbi:MAG: MFS transporter [Alphaproteobacteria bacterium]
MQVAYDRQLFARWLVVGLCFLALALAFSTRAALGLVMPVWSGEFDWSRSFVSGVGAMALIVMACAAPAAGRLVDRYGPRLALVLGLIALAAGSGVMALNSSPTVLVAAYSVVTAIGFGIIATHVVSTGIARLFDRQRGLAIGIATSGATAGQFVIVPIIALILASFSWRWSFAALAALASLLAPLIWHLLKPEAMEASNAAASMQQAGMGRDTMMLLRQPVFHALFWSFLLCGYTTTGIIETHLIPYAAFCGFPPLPSATAYGLLSAVNMLGMIAAGWLTDRINRPLLLGTIYIVRGFTFLILMNVGASYETLVLFAIMFGVVDYATVPVTASLVASHLGLERMGLAMGMISAGHALGGAAGTFAGGYLFDASASYGQIWWSGVWLAIVAGLMVLPLGDHREPALAR